MNRRNEVGSGQTQSPRLTPLWGQFRRQYLHDVRRQVKKYAVKLQSLVDELPVEIYTDGSAILDQIKHHNADSAGSDLGSKLANAGYGVTELILAGAEYSSRGWLLVGTNVIVVNNLYHDMGWVKSYNIPDTTVYQHGDVFVLVSGSNSRPAPGRIDLHQLAMRLRDSWDIVDVRFVTKPDYEKLAKQRGSLMKSYQSRHQELQELQKLCWCENF